LNFDDSPDEERETLPDSGVVRIDEDIDENERIEVLPPDELTEFDDEDANKEIEIPEIGDMNTPDLSTQEDPNAEQPDEGFGVEASAQRPPGQSEIYSLFQKSDKTKDGHLYLGEFK